MEIKIEVNIPEGEHVATFDEGQFLCPLCGSELELKRSKTADFMEDINEQPVNIIRRTYYCPTCEHKLYTQVWRPYGENDCCQLALGHLHRSQEQVVKAWVEKGHDALYYKRISSYTCTCGRHYIWPEMGAAPLAEH